MATTGGPTRSHILSPKPCHAFRALPRRRLILFLLKMQVTWATGPRREDSRSLRKRGTVQRLYSQVRHFYLERKTQLSILS